ncbi:MAG: UDP-N-acetylmuramoyl-L-alanyl-D-glutamate--2,6-diaminopimelate ligase [Huintestinicola sp.]
MKLSDLLAEIPASEISYKGKNMEIKGLTDDTRNVREGYIFFCIKGASFDGHTAAEDMLRAGAALVVCSHDLKLGDRQIIVKDTRSFYGIMCARWFGNPERHLKLIGVTGTNGKTTTASMIHYILTENRVKTGFIGTTGALIGNTPIPRDDSTPTTPKVFELYSIFAKMAASGCSHVVMEVSSFALEQNRIGPAKFKAAVFTNLTQDHLDYHKTMENYYLAKKKLFTDHCETAFINTDDEYGKRLYSEISCEKFSLGSEGNASVYASQITSKGISSSFLFNAQGIKAPVTLPMPGSFNISNSLAAIAICIKLGLQIKQIHIALSKFPGVRGRCEVIPTGRDFTIICDYAHSPDALENMLPIIKESAEGRLICLFGCGGDRDRTKRPLMAAAAAKYSDYLIITSDNPRNEDPDAIIDEILTGIEGTAVPYDRITDRKEAIFHAVRIAAAGDIVVLAGKGHEDYQILAGGEHIHFDEREIAAEALKAVPDIRPQPVNFPPSLSIKDIAKFIGGSLYMVSDPDKAVPAVMISSDTRSIRLGSIFIALKGERFDGHDFVEEAVKKGAIAAITSRPVPGIPCIVARDTSKALLDLARGYRSRFSIPLVGITGSVGKTTTKELTALALSTRFNVLKTQGNLNNEVGMPFTLLRLAAHNTAAVIEMGMSHAGEIERLSKTSLPDLCIITNIGESHMENLGSRENIMKAKLEILTGASCTAPLIINGDDDMLIRLKTDDGTRKIITCGIVNMDCDYRGENIVTRNGCLYFDICCGNDRYPTMLPCMGRHNALDAVIAFAAAMETGCDPVSVCAMLSSFHPDGLRQHIEERNGQRMIVDCYNAAPVSMRAAIDVLCDTTPAEGGRRVCILGDMLELGDTSPRLHAEVGEYAASKGVDMVITLGTLAENISAKAASMGVMTFAAHDKDEAVNFMKQNLTPGDILLFKASRGMHMEDVISAYFE